MKEEVKRSIIARHSRSPRCTIRVPNPHPYKQSRSSLYSWKNLLKDSIGSQYETIISRTKSQTNIRLSDEKGSELDKNTRFSRNNELSSHVIDLHVNNINKEVESEPRTSRFRGVYSEAQYSLKPYPNDRLDTYLSFDSQASLRCSAKMKNSFKSQRQIDFSTQYELPLKRSRKEDDSYHQQLKEQQRKYLLAKFMEHVEKVHKIKL